MFHPTDKPMVRGWVGRLDGDRVVHLAAQTLQHFFSGGSSSREHDVYARDAVTLVVPVLHPPAVRVFESADLFSFANPAAVFGPGAAIAGPDGVELEAHLRLAGLVGLEQTLGGIGLYVEVRARDAMPPKDRDFGSVFGPLVVTMDEVGSDLPATCQVGGQPAWAGDLGGWPWARACELAARGTALRTGDLLVSPAATVVPLPRGAVLELECAPLGALALGVGR